MDLYHDLPKWTETHRRGPTRSQETPMCTETDRIGLKWVHAAGLPATWTSQGN